jgi:hypothetical protein
MRIIIDYSTSTLLMDDNHNEIRAYGFKNLIFTEKL